MSEAGYNKPLPRPNRLSRPYWDGAKEHQLRILSCTSCQHKFLPAADRCPRCLGKTLEWVAASGRGKVWSWVVFHQRYFPAFEADLPYNVAYVELDEGPRLMSNLVDCAVDDIRCDMPVEAFFEDITTDITLPKFRPYNQ